MINHNLFIIFSSAYKFNKSKLAVSFLIMLLVFFPSYASSADNDDQKERTMFNLIEEEDDK